MPKRAELAMELARWCTELDYADIPAEVISRIKAAMLDAAGCALGAVQSEPVRISREVAAELAPAGPCTLLGTSQRTSMEHAAFVNSVAIRYLDYCDVYLGAEVTPPASCASVVWAVCEARGLSGRGCLLGMVVLYEAMLRLCSAASLNRRGWDTVAYQAIASAMATARLIGLSADTAYEAINIAATNAPALLQTRVGELSMWKGVASAYAARGGLISALLAERGMTGPRESFEGKHGLQQQVTGAFDLPAAGQWRIPQVLIKKFPAQVYTQAAIEAALELRDQLGGDPGSGIDKVIITTFRRAIDHTAGSPDRWAPRTRETADHSLPFLVASALLHGTVGPAQFDPASIADPRIAALMSRITVAEDPEMTARYPDLMPVRVELRRGGGDPLTVQVLAHEGHPARPMPMAGLKAKFLRLAAEAVSAGQAADLWQCVHGLQDAADISGFTGATVPSGQRDDGTGGNDRTGQADRGERNAM